MDSSRGGPLSTLILMLPLIVVPALVVLRPPERNGGFRNDDLAAADGDEFTADPDDFDTMFGDALQTESSHDLEHSAELDLLNEPLTNPGAVDPETVDRRNTQQTDERHSGSPSIPSTGPDGKRTPDLSRWGVTQSVWFAPGDIGAVGFAVFVPTKDERVRYRFAAIGTTDRQVIRDVVHQIEDWQSTQTASSDRRAN